MSLKNAIETVDAATDNGAVYFLINCAHPDHFSHILADEPGMQRVRGVVVNASRCSHLELDDAKELDPDELGLLVGDLCKNFPYFTVVVGGCLMRSLMIEMFKSSMILLLNSLLIFMNWSLLWGQKIDVVG